MADVRAPLLLFGFLALAVGVVVSATAVFGLGLVTPHGDDARLVVTACGVLGVLVLVRAGRSARRQVVATRRLLEGLPVLGPLADDPSVLLFCDPAPRAFCAGLLRPRVLLSTGAVRALGDAELAAVVAHEAHHARRRDPLRLAALRVAADSLAFLPAVRPLAARYAELLEIDADRAAVDRCAGDPAPLARALLLFDDAVADTAVGIAPERIDVLLGRTPRWPLPLVLAAWTLLALAGLAALTLRGTEVVTGSTLDLDAFGASLCFVVLGVLPLLAAAAALLTVQGLGRR